MCYNFVYKFNLKITAVQMGEKAEISKTKNQETKHKIITDIAFQEVLVEKHTAYQRKIFASPH